MNGNKTNNYQLDLTPFISLLSVCICFLLLTVAWFQIGSLTMRQALGGDKTEETKSPALWIHLKKKNHIQIQLKKKPSTRKSLASVVIASPNGDQPNYEALEKHIKIFKKNFPGLTQAFILPQGNISYEEIIKVMDRARSAGIFSLGISPI